jgi:hypothetical protein
MAHVWQNVLRKAMAREGCFVLDDDDDDDDDDDFCSIYLFICIYNYRYTYECVSLFS